MLYLTADAPIMEIISITLETISDARYMLSMMLPLFPCMKKHN